MRQSTIARAVILAVATAALPLAAQAAQPSKDRYIVKFKAGKKATVKESIGKAFGKVQLELDELDAMAIEVPAQALKGLANNPNVEYVEEDAVRYPFALTYPSSTPGQVVPYGIKLTQADQLSDAAAGNRKVCIIDSGYDNAHEDLKGNNVTGEYDRGTGWWYTDENHHGTHVAGTIAAINNGTGVVGVNANKTLKLHIVKVFGADGWAYSSTLAAAANKCGTAGANVISMSLGGGRSNKTEQRAFDALYSKGVLNIAAAGNDGNTVISYPAGYSSVMMVGALDENKQWATFSQYNSKVEISAPGVSVLSTVTMGGGRDALLTVAGACVMASPMDGSPAKTATGAIADCGIGDKTCVGVTGKVCLIQRGTVDFATKVTSCSAGGGIGAIIYNNTAGMLSGTMGTVVTTIPSVGVSDVDGAVLKSNLGSSATVAVNATNYAFYDGTSMATPHVSAVAALVWSYFPTCTGANIRKALTATAEDLGTAGRDTKYGFGLVRAANAKQYLTTYGCAGA